MASTRRYVYCVVAGRFQIPTPQLNLARRFRILEVNVGIPRAGALADHYVAAGEKIQYTTRTKQKI